MPRFIRFYVRYVDKLSATLGRLVMYLALVMMAILLYSSISRSLLDIHHLWIVEMAQFVMTAYYLLGGAWSMQLDAHVRMDVWYEKWTPKRRALVDSITSFCLLFYLFYLLYGGFSSAQYALETGQKNYSAWAPPMAPIKIIMTIGIAIMLLQAIATLIKDIAKAKGLELNEP